MAANETATERSITMAFRHLASRRQILREIQKEKGYGSLSDVLQEAVDEKIARHLSEKPTPAGAAR